MASYLERERSRWIRSLTLLFVYITSLHIVYIKSIPTGKLLKPEKSIVKAVVCLEIMSDETLGIQ